MGDAPPASPSRGQGRRAGGSRRTTAHSWPWSPGAVYICTEDAFPNKRLQQLIAQQQRLRTDAPADVVEKIRFGDHIFIDHAADVVSILLSLQPWAKAADGPACRAVHSGRCAPHSDGTDWLPGIQDERGVLCVFCHPTHEEWGQRAPSLLPAPEGTTVQVLLMAGKAPGQGRRAPGWTSPLRLPASRDAVW